MLAAEAIEDASRSAFERATAHRDLARANLQSGMRSPIELTLRQADVARYEAGMMRATAGVHVARSMFAVAVGVDDIELDAAGGPADAGALPPLSSLLGMAGASPNVLEGRARVEAQHAETEANPGRADPAEPDGDRRGIRARRGRSTVERCPDQRRRMVRASRTTARASCSPGR